MIEFLGISYKLSKSDNFEEFMKALGIGLVTRKIGNAVSPVVKLTEKDGVFTLHTSSTFKNQEISFKGGNTNLHTFVTGLLYPEIVYSLDNVLPTSQLLTSSEQESEVSVDVSNDVNSSEVGERLHRNLTMTRYNNLVTNPGVEFEEETPDGRKVKSVVKFEGNKMFHTQHGEQTIHITREFSGQEMKAVFKVGDVVCTRVYVKVD